MPVPAGRVPVWQESGERRRKPVLPCPGGNPDTFETLAGLPEHLAGLKDKGRGMQPSDELLHKLRQAVVGMVRENGPHPTARQLAVFLTAYLDEGPHTVARTAVHLNVQKAAVSRAIDRLTELNLARRTVDPLDRRKIHIQQTSRGLQFLGSLGRWVNGQAASNDNVAHGQSMRLTASTGRGA